MNTFVINFYLVDVIKHYFLKMDNNIYLYFLFLSFLFDLITAIILVLLHNFE